MDLAGKAKTALFLILAVSIVLNHIETAEDSKNNNPSTGLCFKVHGPTSQDHILVCCTVHTSDSEKQVSKINLVFHLLAADKVYPLNAIVNYGLRQASHFNCDRTSHAIICSSVHRSLDEQKTYICFSFLTMKTKYAKATCQASIPNNIEQMLNAKCFKVATQLDGNIDLISCAHVFGVKSLDISVICISVYKIHKNMLSLSMTCNDVDIIVESVSSVTCFHDIEQDSQKETLVCISSFQNVHEEIHCTAVFEHIGALGTLVCSRIVKENEIQIYKKQESSNKKDGNEYGLIKTGISKIGWLVNSLYELIISFFIG